MKIHLVLTDDWELRGDGSGNARAIQFDTLKKITKIYDNYGLKGSFNVELMQQFYHKKFGDKFSELQEISDEWEEVVKDAFSRGHDMQIHLHTHWIDGTYNNFRWDLTSDWNIVNYNEEIADKLIKQSISYLEGLLKPIDSNYKSISFRAGTWAIAPSDFIIRVLKRNQMIFDMSLVNNLVSNFPVKFDYTNLEEPFLPYYPNLNDARRIGTSKNSIICVPTHSFYARTNVGFYLLEKLRNHKIFSNYVGKLDRYLSPRVINIKDAGYNLKEYSYFINGNSVKPRNNFWNKIQIFIQKKHRISDLSILNYSLFKKMMSDIREKAYHSSLEFVPIIIANHTKNIGNFESIEKHAEYLANANDIEVITTTQLAKNLKAGLYPIRSTDSL
ncbi:MAG: hypothetical protein HND52_18950 [Ignavibacteriae bacterium]|nr:hypothetical protein [Ignavibacteriota bacterium]NOH00045.1 hypothetical protein [Ignavibacteriota bacterium]